MDYEICVICDVHWVEIEMAWLSWLICVKRRCVSILPEFIWQFHYFISYMIILPQNFPTPNYIIVNHYLHSGLDAMVW